MEALGRFGLDPVQLAAQLVNFLIIAFLLWRFLLKPLLATMDARKAKIAKGLDDAEKARQELAAASAERDRIVGEAYKQAAAIIESTRAEGERLRAQAAEQAGRDAERILAHARESAELERREAEGAVRELSLELAGRVLDRVVATLFSGEEKRRIVSRGLEQIRRLR